MNKISKVALVLTFIFEITLLIHGLQVLGEKEGKGPDLLLAMGTLTIPFLMTFLANRLKIKLPPGFLGVGVIFIFLAQYFGEVKQFYQTIWWWDLLLHGIFGLLGVLFALNLLGSHITGIPQISSSRFTLVKAILSFCFSTACSALWEMFEFVGDILLPVKMVKGGLEDSMSDLLIGSGVSLLTALGYYFLWRYFNKG